MNRQHQINFLGIYYSIDGGHFSKANTAPIRFIDAQGNVGLLIGGAPVTLLAVRQFGNDVIPLRYPGLIPKNCERPLLPNGHLADGDGQFTIEGDLFSERPVLKVGFEEVCRDRRFRQFFASNASQAIYHRDALRVFIGSAGNILVESQHFDDLCGKWYRNLAHTENIVHELCHLAAR